MQETARFDRLSSSPSRVRNGPASPARAEPQPPPPDEGRSPARGGEGAAAVVRAPAIAVPVPPHGGWVGGDCGGAPSAQAAPPYQQQQDPWAAAVVHPASWAAAAAQQQQQLLQQQQAFAAQAMQAQAMQAQAAVLAQQQQQRQQQQQQQAAAGVAAAGVRVGVTALRRPASHRPSAQAAARIQSSANGGRVQHPPVSRLSHGAALGGGARGAGHMPPPLVIPRSAPPASAVASALPRMMGDARRPLSQPIARGRPRAGRAGVGGGGMAEPRGGRQLRSAEAGTQAAAAMRLADEAPAPPLTADGPRPSDAPAAHGGRRHSYAGHSYAGRQRGREAPLGYKPYSGAVSNEYVRMGNLKPDLNTEELTTKRANLARVRPQPKQRSGWGRPPLPDLCRPTRLRSDAPLAHR